MPQGVEDTRAGRTQIVMLTTIAADRARWREITQQLHLLPQ